MSSGDRWLIPHFVPNVDSEAFEPRYELIRCSLCVNAVRVVIVHNVFSSDDTGEQIIDDGRPFVIEQLGRLGWTVHEAESEIWAECRNHSVLSADAHAIAAEFDVRAFDIVANTYELACLACSTAFSVTVSLRPDEVFAAAGQHFNGCQQTVIEWSDVRANLGARRPDALSTFELVGSRETSS